MGSAMDIGFAAFRLVAPRTKEMSSSRAAGHQQTPANQLNDAN
jgi:hypothetical protein